MENDPGILYHKLILEQNTSPSHFEKRPDAPIVIDAFNPLCGDKFKIYLDIENQTVARATFYGYGCAVSKASSSVLMKKIQGKPVEEVLEIIREFISRLERGAEPEGEAVLADEETVAFLPVRNFPGRLQCATLSWQALENFLKEQ